MAHGFAVLPGTVDLQPTASGAWVATGLQLVLPAAGTYHLDATVRTAMSANSPVNTYIVARLFDVTAGAVVPNSEAIVQQISLSASAGVVGSGHNNTAPVQVAYLIPGPRTIRVEAARFNSGGASVSAWVMNDGSGRTTLRFGQVA